MARIQLKAGADPEYARAELRKIGIRMTRRLPDGTYQVYIADRALFNEYLKYLMSHAE